MNDAQRMQTKYRLHLSRRKLLTRRSVEVTYELRSVEQRTRETGVVTLKVVMHGARTITLQIQGSVISGNIEEGGRGGTHSDETKMFHVVEAPV